MRDLFATLTPRRLLMASVVVAIMTIALKTGAWWVTGSVGLLSDACSRRSRWSSLIGAWACPW